MTAGRLDQLVTRVESRDAALVLARAAVAQRHPYDTPELTTVPSTFVDDRYLAWARAETID